MKRITIALLTLTAALAAVSCQKEAMLQEKPSVQMTITALAEQIGAQTKAEMAYKYDVLWQENDSICVKDASNSAIFKLTDGAGTTKGTFSGSITPGEVEAYYPASIAGGDKPVWPAVQQNNQVAPMYCKKTISAEAEEFSFKSLGAVMQIVLTTPVEGITLKSIKIEDGAKTMSGAFEVDDNGQANITATDKAGITLKLGEGVAIGDKAKYFNIAIPAGKYNDLTLTFTASDGNQCVLHSTTLPEVKRNVVGKLTISAPKFVAVLPSEAVSGAFSVGEGKQVYFSKGNLQATYNGSSYDWGFAANQYDYIGNAAGNTTIDEQTKGAVVDLFGWSTDATYYGINTSQDNATYSGDFKDWGTAVEGNWRTLSEEEWEYLFNSDNDVNSPRRGLYAEKVTVMGVAGCTILYPDGFTGTKVSDGNTSAYNTEEKWTAAQDAGVVCLPLTGHRLGNEVAVLDRGYYSTSSNNGNDDRKEFFVWSDGVGICSSNGRCPGAAVRLVSDVTSDHLQFAAVESVTLNKTEIELKAGARETLTAIIAPANATNQDIIWTSSNTAVATVYASGKVKGVAAGTAVITAIADGLKTATCAVTVTPTVPYVEIAAKYDGENVTTMRWYRQNLAITESGDKEWMGGNTDHTVKVPGMGVDVIVGDYFQWGASYDGYGIADKKPENLLLYTAFTCQYCGDEENKFAFKDNNKKFSSSYAPYYSASAYTKYTDDDGNTVLEPGDDVASIILGGSWRMPTSAEFQALYDATYWAWDATDMGCYVFAPDAGHPAGTSNFGIPAGLSKDNALLFFPAVGRGSTSSLSPGSIHYSSSTVYSDSKQNYHLYLYATKTKISALTPQKNADRYYGNTVRPVSPVE